MQPLQQPYKLIKRGAEADIYLTYWYGKKAISKIRLPKTYRHKSLDNMIRKYRTIHEANMISAARIAGVISPFVYFIDPIRAEIIMDFVKGKNAKDVISRRLSVDIGKYTAQLHKENIVHGDLTTSNFISGNKLVLLDFGLSYYSERIEDRAVDIRLIKEVFSSVHVSKYEDLYNGFITGYSEIMGRKKMSNILWKVADIERRGRYARFV